MTEPFIMDRGRWAGERITRIPVGYLKWMIQAQVPGWVEAQIEVARRGHTIPTLDLSGHAIDRASLRCRAIWHETAKDPEEGLHSWLLRISREALDQAQPDAEGAIYYLGLKLVFDNAGKWPTLKTLFPWGKK